MPKLPNIYILQQLKGMQRFKVGYERGTISQSKVYEMGTFSAKNGI